MSQGTDRGPNAIVICSFYFAISWVPALWDLLRLVYLRLVILSESKEKFYVWHSEDTETTGDIRLIPIPPEACYIEILRTFRAIMSQKESIQDPG